MTTRISETEALALQILETLYLLSEGRPQAPFKLAGTLADAEAAMQLAADNGWVLLDRDGSVWLTGKGRRLIELSRPPARPQFMYTLLPQQESDHYFSECPYCGHMVDELDLEELMQHLDPDHEAPVKN